MNTTQETPTSAVKAIPEHYRGAVPYLYVDNAEQAIAFYKTAFDAKELITIRDSNNKIGHCELQIGNARIMLSDEYPELNVKSPKTLGASTSGFTLFFEDANKAFQMVLQAGAKELRPVEKQFCGDIEGKLVDPFGHQWFIATHVEDVPYDMMKQRAQESMQAH